MKITKAKILAFALIMAFTLAACGGGNNGNSGGSLQDILDAAGKAKDAADAVQGGEDIWDAIGDAFNPDGGNNGGDENDYFRWTFAEDSTFTGSEDYGLGYTEITALEWIGDKFLLCGAGGFCGEMAYSYDGVTWTKIDHPFGDDFGVTAFAHGDGVIVAALFNRIGRSTDGINWTEVPTDGMFEISGFDGIKDITYGNGKFVTVGKKGKMWESADGITWTAIADTGFEKNKEIRSIAWSGSMFVAVGEDDYKHHHGIVYSPDGTNWTLANEEQFSEYPYLDLVIWGGGKFIAVGSNSDGNIMYHSTDGKTWTEVVLGDELFKNEYGIGTNIAYIQDIVYNGSMYVAVASNQPGAIVAYSKDGVKWVRAEAEIFGKNLKTQDLYKIAYGNGRFVIGVGRGKIMYSKIMG